MDRILDNGKQPRLLDKNLGLNVSGTLYSQRFASQDSPTVHAGETTNHASDLEVGAGVVRPTRLLDSSSRWEWISGPSRTGGLFADNLRD